MGEFPSGQRGQTVNLLSLTSMVRIHLLPPNKKHPEGCFFCLVRLTSAGSQPPAGGTSASLKCGRNLRFPHKRPLPDCGGAGWKSRMPFCWAGLAVDGSWLLWEGQPLRSNVAGTCGFPTNAPSLTVEREWAAKRSERFSLLNKKARLRSCLFLRFQLPGRRHLRPLPRLCRQRLPPGSAQPAHPV